MFSLYLSIIFLVKISSALYPGHIDLEKVGVAIFFNEKYNILKPTIHKVNHYRDTTLRRENKGNEKVFIDDNGNRHFWSDFGPKNLRKADTAVATTKSTEKAETIQIGGRTMAKVAFFCPFLGVINMNAFID